MKASKRGSRKKTKKIEAADPLDRDLSALLREGQWRPVRYEFRPKKKTVTLRMSEDLLKAVKTRAAKRGLDYQKFIRLALEKELLSGPGSA